MVTAGRAASARGVDCAWALAAPRLARAATMARLRGWRTKARTVALPEEKFVMVSPLNLEKMHRLPQAVLAAGG